MIARPLAALGVAGAGVGVGAAVEEIVVNCAQVLSRPKAPSSWGR